MRDAYVNRQKDTKSDKKIPVAYAAHRYGIWGYIWHTETDVAEWIKTTNSKIPNRDAWWQGPVALHE